MTSIVKRTIESINHSFKTKQGFILCEENPIYCPQVNGLVNLCLSKLGFPEQAKDNLARFLASPSYNPTTGLFHREVDKEGRPIVPSYNTCKNSIMALALSENGFHAEAEKILESLKTIPLYLQNQGLFAREYGPETKKLNPLVVTQSNLWAALAYSSIGKAREANQLIQKLEQARYDPNQKLFISQDCSDTSHPAFFFLDDQALAILAYQHLKEPQKAQALLTSVLQSPLYDPHTGLFNSRFSETIVDNTKSTYKNSLMAIALNALNYKNELSAIQTGLLRILYDPMDSLFRQSTKDQTKIPDNSALALLAMECNNRS